VKASDWRCPFSGGQANQGHHLSGRDNAGVYLDPPLVLPLSRREHNLEHQCWGRTSFAESSTAHSNYLRLRRTGHVLVRLGNHHGDGVLWLPAETVRQLGLMLHRVADSWEVRP
jgi:hypothetical protein